MWIVRRRCRGDGAEGVVARLAAERTRTRPVDRAVDHDPVQPRAEGAQPVEAVERPDGGEEGLLGDVFGRRGVMHDEVRSAVRARPVMPEERLEVGDRAALRAAHPGALGARHPGP